MANKNIIGTTTSSFQYRLESNIGEILGTLEENILDFETVFSSGDFTQKELNEISNNLKTTARYFGEQQGLDRDKYGFPTEILDHIKTDIQDNSIRFYNDVHDEYGRYYAGFVEYGHYSKNRKSFVIARPFMRPALYAVSKASSEEIGFILKDLLLDIFRDDGKGYQGIHKLKFGTGLKNKSNNFVVKKLSSETLYGIIDDNNSVFRITGKDLSTFPGFEYRLGSRFSSVRGFSGARQRQLAQGTNFKIPKKTSKVSKGTSKKAKKNKGKKSNSTGKKLKPPSNIIGGGKYSNNKKTNKSQNKSEKQNKSKKQNKQRKAQESKKQDKKQKKNTRQDRYISRINIPLTYR